MFSLQRLINNTPEERLMKARNTSSVNLLNVIGGGEKFQKSKNWSDLDKTKPVTLVFEVVSDTSKIHKSVLNFPKGLGLDLPLKVFCDCADFKYRLAYVMWKEGSYFGTPPPGIKDFPEKTNPNLIPYLCKHLAAITMSMIDSGIIKTT